MQRGFGLTVCAIIAIAGSAANAQSIDWLMPVDGDWAIAGNWAGGNVPDNAGEIAVLGLSGMYTVTSDTGRTLGGLMLTNPDAALNLGINTYSLSGDLLNHGLVTLNYANSIFNSALNFQTNATLSGTGVIRLVANSANNDAQINASSGTLIHGSGHTIAGSGLLSGSMTNSGDIIADDPKGVGLSLNGSLSQTASGRVGADAGKLSLGNGSLTTGGEFFTLNGGVINVASSLAMIGDIDNTGAITINGGAHTLALASSIENNGSITINADDNIFNSHLRFEQAGAINGTGSISMSSAGSDSSDAQLYTNGAFTGTIGSGQTVSGSGIIDGRSGGSIINNGTVIANDPDFPLVLGGVHAPGSGVYRAEGDGVLGLGNNSVLTGVLFDSAGNGTIDVVGTNSRVDTVINNGSMRVPGQSYFLVLDGPLTNNGTITLNNNANIFNAHMRFDANTQIGGTGTIDMLAAGGDRGDAQIFTSPGITATLGAGQTITGAGWIDGRSGGSLVINSTVIATDPANPLSIDGNIDATGGGVFRGDEASVSLDAGLVLTGGTFESVGAGEVGVTLGGSASVSGVTNNGTMSIYGQSSFLDLQGDLTNNGLCLINSNMNIFNAHMRAINSVAINGSGTVRLLSPTDINDAQVFTNDVFTLTIGANQTVAGAGIVDGRNGGTIINNGTINGDDPLAELRLLGNHIGPGVYRADDGTLGLGSGLVMNGGTFETSGTGAVAKVDGGTSTLSNITNNGQLNLFGNSTFIDLATNLTNNGEIWINSDGAIFNAHVRFTDSFAIDGTGTIRMNAANASDDAQIISNGPATGTIGAGQTVVGDGRLVGNINIEGILDPGGATRTFTADNLTLASSAEMIVDLGGPSIGEYDRVVLSGADVMNIAGTLTINVDPGYGPAFGETWDIISGGSTTGTFDEVITASAPLGQVYRAIYAPNRVFVILTCDADLSGDGGIDFFDVSAFLNFFGNQDIRGDINGDGLFNFFDVSTFLQLFGEGCNP